MSTPATSLFRLEVNKLNSSHAQRHAITARFSSVELAHLVTSGLQALRPSTAAIHRLLSTAPAPLVVLLSSSLSLPPSPLQRVPEVVHDRPVHAATIAAVCAPADVQGYPRVAHLSSSVAGSGKPASASSANFPHSCRQRWHTGSRTCGFRSSKRRSRNGASTPCLTSMHGHVRLK